MLTASVGRGLRAVIGHGRTAAILWLANLALASVALLPIWSWWMRTTMLPETDPLLERFQVGVFRDLLIDGGGLGVGLILLTIAGLLIVALPVSVFLAGGTLEVLVSEDGLPFFQRFLRGGGHFFWRFLRLAIVHGAIMIVTVAIVAIAANVAVAPLNRSSWAPAAFVAVAIQAVAIGLAATYFLLSLDYARIHLALSDRGGVVRAWLGALWLVGRHPVRTFGLALVFAVLFGLAAAGYLFVIAQLGTHTMSLILASIALQQLFILIRASLRVGLLAGEMELYQWLRPASVPGGRFAPAAPPAPAADDRIDLSLAQ
ncbi:MAG TPA: hypothetical protein VH679_03475 [Vicinamibacterales bacterium]